MRLKTYFTSSVNEAIARARQELGPDALLVHSKRTSGENLSLGSYEVVFALQSAQQPSSAAPTSAKQQLQIASATTSPSNGSGTDLAAMREALDKAYRLVRRTEAMLNSQVRPPGPDAEVACALAESGFSRGFRSRAMRDLTVQAGDSAISRETLIQWLSRQLAVDASLGNGASKSAVVALLGANGCGKTSTLVKLAVRFVVASSKSGHIIAIEGDSVSGNETLRCFASILGIGLTVAENVHQFRQALQENASKDIVLIDTPGIGRNQESEVSYLSEFFEVLPQIDKHLLIPADVNLVTARRQAERFAPLRPEKVMLTRMDEAGESLSAALEAVITLGLPLSFCTTGSRIPEDLEIADPPSYVERLLPDWLGLEQSGQRSKQATA
ncbi:flagellar biosynthesis protein FlhF [Bryobacterales bacterium F-183]|nr:flagellar biosynthesis protein FlhF [Bryobacterales bacterium F-183]